MIEILRRFSLISASRLLLLSLLKRISYLESILSLRLNMQSSIQINKDGKLTKAQKFYLLGQLAEKLGFMLIWLLGAFSVGSIYKNESILNFYTIIITFFEIAGMIALVGYIII